MKKLIGLFILISLGARASTIWWAGTNWLAGAGFSSATIISPVNPTPLNNGTFIYAGPAQRFPATNGLALWTNAFSAGTYRLDIENLAFSKPVIFDVPNDNLTYSLMALSRNSTNGLFSVVMKVTSTNGTIGITPTYGNGQSVDLEVVASSAAPFIGNLNGNGTNVNTWSTGNTASIFAHGNFLVQSLVGIPFLGDEESGTNALLETVNVPTGATFLVDSNANVSTTGKFYGNGLGLTNVPGSSIVNPLNTAITITNATGAQVDLHLKGSAAAGGVDVDLQSTSGGMQLLVGGVNSMFFPPSGAMYANGVMNGNGNGITNTTLVSKNVKDFGATGNGVTDDTLAIVAAYTAWTNLPQAGRLFFPAGVYQVATNFYMTLPAAPTTVGGYPWVIEGERSVIRLTTSNLPTNYWFRSEGVMPHLSKIQFVGQGLSVMGSGPIANKAITAWAHNGPSGDYVLDDVSCNGFSGFGHLSFDSYNVTLKMVTMTACGTGLGMGYKSDGWSGDIVCRGCSNAVEIGVMMLSDFTNSSHSTLVYGNCHGDDLKVQSLNISNLAVIVGGLSQVTLRGYSENQQPSNWLHPWLQIGHSDLLDAGSGAYHQVTLDTVAIHGWTGLTNLIDVWGGAYVRIINCDLEAANPWSTICQQNINVPLYLTVRNTYTSYINDGVRFLPAAAVQPLQDGFGRQDYQWGRSLQIDSYSTVFGSTAPALTLRSYYGATTAYPLSFGFYNSDGSIYNTRVAGFDYSNNNGAFQLTSTNSSIVSKFIGDASGTTNIGPSSLTGSVTTNLYNFGAGPLLVPQVYDGVVTNVAGFEPETISWINRAGIVSPGEMASADQVMKSLKANGYPATLKLDAWYPFSGGTSNSMAMNLLNTNYAITWGSSAHITASTNGVTSDGNSLAYGIANIYLDGSHAPFNATNYTTTSSSFGVFCSSLPPSGTGNFLLGAYDNGSWRADIVYNAGAGSYNSHVNNNDPPFTLGSAAPMAVVVSRSSGTVDFGFAGTSAQVIDNSSSVSPSTGVQMGIFCRNNSGTPGAFATGGSLRCSWLGASNSVAQAQFMNQVATNYYLTLSNYYATTVQYGPGSFTGNGSGLTNNLITKAANYIMQPTDRYLLLSGNLTATLPTYTLAGVIGNSYTVFCNSAGTNAILPSGAETFTGKGATGVSKWTNSAVGNSTTLISDGTKWCVIKTDN